MASKRKFQGKKKGSRRINYRVQEKVRRYTRVQREGFSQGERFREKKRVQKELAS